jgi:RNA polymerase sigma factor (sigma-70 family)
MPMSDSVLREVRRFVAAARPDDDSDRDLLGRFARSRDEPAFAALVRRHGPMVLGVCRRVLRHSADADDAFQATFLILVRRAADVRDPARLGPWLFGVAWRTANRLRATRRAVLPITDDLPARQPPAGDWPAELDAAIAGLPERYRNPIVLCHLQGLTTTEAARQLGCPPGTVATRLFRARNTLRRRLTALGLAVPVALVTDSALYLPAALASAAQDLAIGRTTSPAAAHLADGVFRSLLMTKLRWAATAAAVCLTTVGVLGFRAGGQEPAAGPPPPAVAPAVAGPPPVSEAAQEAATVKTANFRVTAPSARIARLIADAAERARKDAAVAWLGKELPTRDHACRITVAIGRGTSGATSFTFDGGPIAADMRVEGELDRLLADVIPHQVTHVVLADHFKSVVPRWADEGIALLSESAEEQARYLQMFVDAANAGHAIQFKALCATRDFPANVTAFFAESYWLAKVLVDRKDRATLITFVRGGMKDGWEAAAKSVYGATLDELEGEMSEKVKTERKARRVVDQRPKPALVFALATADAAGRITVFHQQHLGYEPVTTYVRRDMRVEGTGQTRTYMEPVTNYRPRTSLVASLSRGTVKAIMPQGKAIDEATLIEALKGKTVAVVVVADGQGIDKAFTDLLKPDTLILIVPAAKPEPVPPAPTAQPGM